MSRHKLLLIIDCLVLCCCAPPITAAAAHRDAHVVAKSRRSQRGVDVTCTVAANTTSCTCSRQHTRSSARTFVTRYRGGGVVVDQDEQTSESFLERHPFGSGVTITCVKAVAADVFTQLIVQSKPVTEWDVQRTILFGAFGLLFQGCAQYAVVNVIWERLFPGASPKSVVAKILGMNLLSDPLLFFPSFYIFQTFLEQRQLAVGAAMDRYSQNCWSDWRNSWVVWMPGHAITYGVMPPHRRIPWMAFLSFFYMCILSFTRGGGRAD
jgi:hypothetical protein